MMRRQNEKNGIEIHQVGFEATLIGETSKTVRKFQKKSDFRSESKSVLSEWSFSHTS